MPSLRKVLPLLMLVTLSGCATSNIIYMATHEHETYFNDHYKSVEKAAVTPDDTLIVLVQGTPAGSKSGRYLVTIPLPGQPAPNAGSLASAAVQLTMGSVLVSQTPQPLRCTGARWNLVTNDLNCELLMQTDLLAVTIAPFVTLPSHEDPLDVIAGDYQQFPGYNDAKRTLYCVDNRADDNGQELVYIEKGGRKIVVDGGFKAVTTPHYYPYLLWLPVTIPADAATLPFQIILSPILSAGYQ